jgi:two-component system KDP operon response regulator KdpE
VSYNPIKSRTILEFPYLFFICSLFLAHYSQKKLVTESPASVLIVDDDYAIRKALCGGLRASSFHTDEAASGEQAITLMRSRCFDAVVLDINMPGMGGMATCRELRQMFPGISILILSVNDSPEQIIEALDAGADDYVVKPFHFRELTARLRAGIRRVRAGRETAAPSVAVGGIEADPARRTVKKHGQLVHFTPKEFDLLYYLMCHAGQPVTYGRLLRAVWGPEYGHEREYLRTFIRQLRVKIEDQPAAPAYLLTDAYVGYRFGQPAQL